MASTKVLESGLNANQEKFCQYYVSKDSFANGVESYASAYGIELTEKTYNSCKVLASKLLTNVNVLARINKLLDLSGLNDSFVDKQLTFVILQNADMSSKVKAISEYNKIKGRITDKLEIKGDFDITLKLE
jgi:phage terminase small subunit